MRTGTGQQGQDSRDKTVLARQLGQDILPLFMHIITDNDGDLVSGFYMDKVKSKTNGVKR